MNLSKRLPGSLIVVYGFLVNIQFLCLLILIILMHSFKVILVSTGVALVRMKKGFLLPRRNVSRSMPKPKSAPRRTVDEQIPTDESVVESTQVTGRIGAITGESLRPTEADAERWVSPHHTDEYIPRDPNPVEGHHQILIEPVQSE